MGEQILGDNLVGSVAWVDGVEEGVLRGVGAGADGVRVAEHGGELHGACPAAPSSHFLEPYATQHSRYVI